MNGQDQMRRDKSQCPTESSGRSKDDHIHSKPRSSHSDQRSGRHGRNSGQSPKQKSALQKDESLAAKLMARKEHNKRYVKVVKNLMLYLEERYHQIDPAEHQMEVHSMRFFGAGAESAAIEVLALIDWATKFLELSHSPILEIPAFLCRPFIMGKKVQFPIPEDPTDAIHKEKCVRTKAQKAWVYLCALLQFWTDEAMMEFCEIMYGGRHWPANPMIAQIRAMLNPSFGEHFQITWASIAASTSWTQARLYFRPPERERFRSEPGPTPDMQNPLETVIELRWETYLWEEIKDLSFTTPLWAGMAGRLQLPSRKPEARHLTEAESLPPGFTRTQRKTPEEQEAVAKYQTPSEPSLRQTIDEELGIQDVTTIDGLGTPQQRQSWHRQLRASMISLSPWMWTLYWQNIHTRRSRMMHRNYWERPRDQTLPWPSGRIESLTRQLDSPGPQGTADRPPDLRPGLPVVRLRDELEMEETEDEENWRWKKTEDGTRKKTILN